MFEVAIEDPQCTTVTVQPGFTQEGYAANWATRFQRAAGRSNVDLIARARLSDKPDRVPIPTPEDVLQQLLSAKI